MMVDASSRMLPSLLLAGLACAACHRVTTPEDTGPQQETGGTDTGDPPDTADTGRPMVDGVLEVSVSTEHFEAIGYEVARFEVTEEAPDPYQSLYPGERPSFWLIRPSDVDPSERLPLLLFTHGGGLGDDSEETPYACEQHRIESYMSRHLHAGSSMAVMVAHRRWAMVLPRNDWCDGWTGLGPDDPVHPEHHYGYYHVSRTLDFLRAGGGGFQVDDDMLFGWGTSGGAAGVVNASYRYGGFKGVVWDSGMASFIAYWSLLDQDLGSTEEEMIHLFGGPLYDEQGNPTEYYERYQQSSASWQISEGGHDARIFVAWNRQDANLSAPHGEEMESAAEAGREPGEWGAHDFDHQYPGDTFHVQTVFPMMPLGYLPYAMFDFIDGERLEFGEAEDGCEEPTCVGEVLENEDRSGYSKGAAVSGPPGTPGLLYAGPLPGWVEPDAPLKVGFAINPSTMEMVEKETVLARIQYLEDGVIAEERVITGEDLGVHIESELRRWPHQYDNTFLHFQPGTPADGEVRLMTTGVTGLVADVVIFLAGG